MNLELSPCLTPAQRGRLIERLEDVVKLEADAAADFTKMELHENAAYHAGRESGLRSAIELIGRI